ncbi:MAG: carboxymuconolactone decarboxylase family protein [Acidimicrobiales bacterium]
MEPADRTEAQRELLSALGGAGALNIFSTLVRAPGLFRRWIPFGGKLLQGSKLPARDRELVILRVSWRCRAPYEWAQHVAIATDAGLSAEEIRRVATGPEGVGWSQSDTTLLTAVDQLLDDYCINDATWRALSSVYDEQQLIELPMLAGHYALLAGTLNSLGVQTEGPLPALGEA